MHSHLPPGRHMPKKLRQLVLILFCCGPATLLAQDPAGAGGRTSPLPDSPQPKSLVEKPVESGPAKFIGYMTNRSIMFPDIATSEGPLTTGGKAKLFVNESISPAYVMVAGINASVEQARNVPKGYGQGWDAYADRFGASMGRASSNAFFGTFVFASALRQDPRFFPQSHPSLWGSIKYSAQRLFVTRTDRGGETLNSSGLLGPLAAETLANVYLPKSEQTGAKTAERFGTDLAWKLAGNMFKNYWPNVFRDLGLNHLKVIPDPPSPNARSNRPTP